ncbi:MAG: hypothetical protein DMG38_07685 [Acidobacteria bacterium]|nr:MAG: hypothetical protein DMG38_07685 [Acidobacteriota bacterium]
MRLPALALAAAFPCGGVLGLAESRPETWRSQVLIDHHGGKNSTTQEFLRASNRGLQLFPWEKSRTAGAVAGRRAYICCAQIAMAPCTF